MPAVHPAWRHINLGRFPRINRGRGLKLLNDNDDLLIVESSATKTKAAERTCKGILPVAPNSINGPRFAERASRGKSNVGQGQRYIDSENPTDYNGSRITQQHIGSF